MSSAAIRSITSRARDAVIVCRKCSKKVRGGFGGSGSERLAEALRRHLSVGEGRKALVAVVECGCLHICPKRRVVVLRGSRPDERLLIAPGTPIADVATRLNLAADQTA